jgi:hypothetical protein
LDYDKKNERSGKRDKNIIGPRIWRETLRNVEKEE